MKRISILLLLAIFGLNSTFAQNGTGFIGDGYYRVCNLVTKRYIYVTDNKDYYDKTRDVGDFQAIQLWKDINRAVSDPASVIYMDEVSSGNFDLKGQGTGVRALTGYYVNAKKITTGIYEVSATAHGVTKYLSDDEQSSTAQGMMGTKGTGNYRRWIVDKIETNHASNYFGIKPTIELNGKYYQPFYADFPFKAVSPNMHIYYISDETGELALIQEIEGGIPANTPVIIECTSADPSQNRLELLTTSPAKITGNKLSGVYFCNGKRPKESTDAYTKFDAAKMRVFNVANGKLVLTNDATGRLTEVKTTDWSDPWYPTIKIKCLPANTSYFKADANTPNVIQLTDDPTNISSIPFCKEKVSATGVYTLSGTRLRTDNNTEGLPAGMYIVGGKKMAVGGR